MVAIVISSGLVIVGSSVYNSLKYKAKLVNGLIDIVSEVGQGKICEAADHSEVTLNGVGYATANEFIIAFNTAIIAVSGGVESSLSAIRNDTGETVINTDYTTEIISKVITPNAPEGITAQTKGGYVTLYAPEANTGVIYVGTDTVCDDTCYAIEAGKSLPIELGDLARVFVKNSVAGEKVHVFGAYKL